VRVGSENVALEKFIPRFQNRVLHAIDEELSMGIPDLWHPVVRDEGTD
jgi:hypothetical protein